MKRFAAQTRESKALRQTAVDSHPRETRPREKGYILLTLMLIVSLMVIFAAAVMPAISFEIKRDREQEMIHRGVQYSRAIRAYYKKFGRYPTRLEDLDNTNNLRYLRKHYKDPITGQDFKLLHFGEPGVTVGSGGLSLGGGSIPGANPAGSPTGMNGASPSGSAFGGQPAFGSSGSGVNSSGVFAQSPGFGGNTNGGPNSGFGTNSNSQTNSGQQGTNAASGSGPYPGFFAGGSGHSTGRHKFQPAARNGRPYRGRGQRQQENHDSRVQQEEEIQRVAVCVRPHQRAP